MSLSRIVPALGFALILALCSFSLGCDDGASDAAEDTGEAMEEAAEDTGAAAEEAAEETEDAVE